MSRTSLFFFFQKKISVDVAIGHWKQASWQGAQSSRWRVVAVITGGARESAPQRQKHGESRRGSGGARPRRRGREGGGKNKSAVTSWSYLRCDGCGGGAAGLRRVADDSVGSIS